MELKIILELGFRKLFKKCNLKKKTNIESKRRRIKRMMLGLWVVHWKVTMHGHAEMMLRVQLGLFYWWWVNILKFTSKFRN